MDGMIFEVITNETEETFTSKFDSTNWKNIRKWRINYANCINTHTIHDTEFKAIGDKVNSDNYDEAFITEIANGSITLGLEKYLKSKRNRG